MYKTIEDLYYGKVIADEIHNTEKIEHKDLHDAVSQLEELFITELSTEQKRCYFQILQKKTEMKSAETAQAFTEGFKTGVRIMTEVYADNEQ